MINGGQYAKCRISSDMYVCLNPFQYRFCNIVGCFLFGKRLSPHACSERLKAVGKSNVRSKIFFAHQTATICISNRGFRSAACSAQLLTPLLVQMVVAGTLLIPLIYHQSADTEQVATGVATAATTVALS